MGWGGGGGGGLYGVLAGIDLELKKKLNALSNFLVHMCMLL